VTFLVTGATGFVGGVLARQPVAAGHRVRAVVRTPEKASGLASLGVYVPRGDVTDKDSLRGPMTGVDGVFHVGAWYKLGVRDRAGAIATNVDGTRHVLELMRELRIPKGVHTSTPGTTFCWAHVDEVVRGHLLAMERSRAGRAYFLAGPPHTLTEGIDVASEVTGIPAPTRRASPAMLKTLAACVGVIERVVPVPPAYAADSLRVLAGTTYIGSDARARTELGWNVRPLREAWVETVRHEHALFQQAAR
jgi:nucleoside-diphosphate-sugar epimerase